MITVTSVGLGAARPDQIESARALLIDADTEFVPPLCWRADTLTLRTTAKRSPTADPYLRAMTNERWLLAGAPAEIVGLLSFRSDRVTAHVTTLIVSRRWRRRGVARRLYNMLFERGVESGWELITTRTWSTNYSHLNLLQGLCFRRTESVHEERAAGVHTYAFAHELEMR